MAGDLNFKVNFDTAQAGQELQTLLEKFVAGSEAAGNKLNRALGGTVERKVVLRTERDDTGIKQLKSELVTIRTEADKLKSAYAAAFKTQPNSITSLRQQLNQAVQARDSINQFGKAIDLTNRKEVISAKQTQQWTDADNRVKALQASLKNLQDADKGFGGRITAGLGDLLEKGRKIQDIVTLAQSLSIAFAAITAPIKAATTALADLDSFRLTFQAIGQSAGTASTALSDSTRVALGLGVSIKTVRESYQQLSPVILNTGGNIQDVSKITEALSSRFAAFGLSADKSRRVLNGVIQAFAKGKLQAEELTQQISEADPAFKTDLANALNKAKGSLGRLGKEVDGTVGNLEKLVKEGKITATVLRQIIPELGKSDILFGKLGPTASSAVEAFKRGQAGLEAIPVTLRQVQTNIENINQLSLERFAKLAEPIVVVLLEAQAAITDFAAELSKSSITKDFISILTQIANAGLVLVKGFLALAQAASVVLGPFVAVLNVLVKIPGVLELIGIAVLGKIIKPFANAAVATKTLIDKFTELSSKKISISSDAGKLASDSEVARKSLINLRNDLQKPVQSGIKLEYEKIAASGDNLTKKQAKQASKIRDEISKLGNEKNAIIQQINNLETQKSEQAASANAKNQRIQQIKQEIAQLTNLENKYKTTASGLRNFYFQQDQAQRKAQGISAKDASFVPTFAGKEDLIKQLHTIDAQAAKVRSQIEPLQQELEKLGSTKVKPEIDLISNVDNTLTNARTRLAELEQQIKTSAKRLARIEIGGPNIETTGQKIDPNKFIDAQKSAESYRNAALRTYVDTKLGSEQYVKQINNEISTLQKRADALRQGSKSAAKLPIAVGGAKAAQDELKATEDRITSLRTQLLQLTASWNRSYKGVLDYSDALTALDSGAKLSAQQLNKLQTAGQVVQVASSKAAQEISDLTNEQKRLQDVVKSLGTDLGKLNFRNVKAPELKGQIKAANKELADTKLKLEGAKNAADLLGQEGAIISAALEQAAAPRPKLEGITNAFKEMQASSNSFVSKFGQYGIGLINTSAKIGNAFKGIGAAIKAIAPDILIFGVIALAVSAYNKSSEAARTVTEENRANLDSLRATVKSLKDDFTALTGATQTNSIDSLVPKLSGLDVVLITLGSGITKAINLFKTWFNVIKGASIDPITGAVTKQYNAYQQLASGIGLVATGAIIGGRTFGTWGAVIGGVTAALTAYVAANNNVSAAIEQLQQQGEATRQGYSTEISLLKELTNQVTKYGDEYNKVKENNSKQAKNKGASADTAITEKEIALYNKAGAAYVTLAARFNSLKEQQKAAYQQSKDLASAVLANSLKESNLYKQKAEASRSGNQAEVKSIESKITALKEQSKVFTEGQNQAVQSYRSLNNELGPIGKTLDELAKKYGFLSKEQLANANSTTNASDAVESAQANLKMLDFTKQREQFNQVAASIGTAKAELEKLEEAAKTSELAGYIEKVKKQLAGNEIPTSLQNMEQLVKALEERTINLDINSPELPKVLADLLKGQQLTDGLDGTKARITLQVIQEGLTTGQLNDTIALREKQAELWNKIKMNSPVNSAAYQEAAAAEQNLAEQKKAADMSVDDARKTLADNEKERIDILTQKEKLRNEKRLGQIDREINKVNDLYDAQIKAVEKESGPAETKLAQQKLNKLKQDATKGGQTGLEAQAELERLTREEKVAKLKEEQQQKITKLEDEKKTIQDTIMNNEYQLIDARIAAEQTILDLRLQAIDKENTAISNRPSSGFASGSNTTNSASDAPGGKNQVVSNAYSTGQEAAKAYVSGYTMSIKAAGPMQNDPNAKVKFNYNDPAVLQADRQRNSLQQEYNQLYQQTIRLEDQNNNQIVQTGQENLGITNQIIQNRQKLADIGSSIYDAENQYASALQNTKTATGEIIITNQTLANQYDKIASKKPSTPVDTASLSQAFDKVSQLNMQYKEQERIVNNLKKQAVSPDKNISGPAQSRLDAENTKLANLRQKLDNAKSGYRNLENAAQNINFPDSILPSNINDQKQQITDWAKGLKNAGKESKNLNSNLKDTSGSIIDIKKASNGLDQSLKDNRTTVDNNLIGAIDSIPDKLSEIENKMDSIFSKTYEVNVSLNTRGSGLWTGGPAANGIVYKVNEIGQEGFMNKFGNITPIKKAQNAFWRAPSDGYVIPADIYSQINAAKTSIPQASVSHATPKAGNNHNDSLKSLAIATASLATKLGNSNQDNNININELSRVQAQQAQEIGRLSHAVTQLVEKDWNVNVKVRNSSQNALIEAMRRKL